MGPVRLACFFIDLGEPHPGSFLIPSERSSNMIKKEVPVWEKSNLTLEEAAAYSGIGIHKLRELSDKEDCEFVLWIGTKRLLKRRKLDEYIERAYSI